MRTPATSCDQPNDSPKASQPTTSIVGSSTAPAMAALAEPTTGAARLGVTLTEPRGRSLRLTGPGSHLAEAAAIAEDVLRSGEEISRWLGTAAPTSVRLALDFLDRAPWFDLFGGTGSFPFRVDLVGSASAVSSRRLPATSSTPGSSLSPITRKRVSSSSPATSWPRPCRPTTRPPIGELSYRRRSKR